MFIFNYINDGITSKLSTGNIQACGFGGNYEAGHLSTADNGIFDFYLPQNGTPTLSNWITCSAYYCDGVGDIQTETMQCSVIGNHYFGGASTNPCNAGMFSRYTDYHIVATAGFYSSTSAYIVMIIIMNNFHINRLSIMVEIINTPK